MKLMPLTYDLNKIKFATDEATFQRASGLYEKSLIEFHGGTYDAGKTTER